MLPIRQPRVLLLALFAAPGLAATYTFDPGRITPQFEIGQLWFYTQHGWFNRTRGTLEYDPAQHTGRLEVSIDAASLETGNEERDTDLKGPHWFDVSHYPSITFRSLQFVFAQDQLVAIEGELTMRGVTQPMTLEIARISCGSQPDSARWCCEADASGALKRSRFGMRASRLLVSDDVRLRIPAKACLTN